MKERLHKRFHEIDIAKGIGILMVILGHCHSNAFLQCTISSMHMPLFFILSGLTLQENLNVKKLIKTYYLWSVLYILFHYTQMNSLEWVYLETYQMVIFWGIEVLWFIATLILAKICLHICIHFISNLKLLLIPLFLFVVVISLIAPTINTWPTTFTEENLFLYYLIIAILRVPVGMFFLLVGKIGVSTFHKILHSSTFITGLIGLLGFVTVSLLAQYNGIVDLHFLKLGNNILLYTLYSILGSCSVILISHGIIQIPFINSFFIFLGKNSLNLMLIHLPILNLLYKHFPDTMISLSDNLRFLVIFIICSVLTIAYQILLKIFHKKRG